MQGLRKIRFSLFRIAAEEPTGAGIVVSGPRIASSDNFFFLNTFPISMKSTATLNLAEYVLIVAAIPQSKITEELKRQ